MLNQQIWLSLNPETRKKLAVYLEIPKSSGCEIVNANGVSKVVSDGHTYEDLSSVTLEKLQNYLAMPKEDDFYKLFGILVKRLEEPEENIEKNLKESKTESNSNDKTENKDNKNKKQRNENSK